ncbi:MAG: hypothetical protein WD037_00140 [Balneolales bacterium]
MNNYPMDQRAYDRKLPKMNYEKRLFGDPWITMTKPGYEVN